MNLDNIEFKNEKRFLSNMFKTEIKFEDNFHGTKLSKRFKRIKFDNFTYESSEHIYQMLKSEDPRWHEIIRSEKDPLKTKSLAKKHLRKASELKDMELTEDSMLFAIREDWENDFQLEVMEVVLMLKFSQNKIIQDKLVNYEGYIEERNDWNDTFWGTYLGRGQNNLGKMLMKMRELFKQVEF